MRVQPKLRSLFASLGVFLVWAACSAQTTVAPSIPSSPTVPSTMIREGDYTALRIQANKLTGKELSTLRAQGQAGDAHAQVLLGMAFQMGCPGSTHDPTEALKWYQLAADQGNSIAANQIAVYHDPEAGFGGGHGHEPEEALAWYRKAAARGDDVVAQYNVGEMLHQLGRDREAVDWYRKATENGDLYGAMRLAEFYDQAKVLPAKSKHENWKEGVESLQRLVDQGNPAAQYVMAQAYREGWLGLHKNPQLGFDLFRKAAAQGWASAILAVGDCYFKGIGVQKDKTEAVKWLQKAADLEDPIALAFMASIYENGDGAPKDLVAAYSWYLLACDYGRKVIFHHHLTTVDMEEAKRRVRVFEIDHGQMNY